MLASLTVPSIVMTSVACVAVPVILMATRAVPQRCTSLLAPDDERSQDELTPIARGPVPEVRVRRSDALPHERPIVASVVVADL